MAGSRIRDYVLFPAAFLVMWLAAERLSITAGILTLPVPWPSIVGWGLNTALVGICVLVFQWLLRRRIQRSLRESLLACSVPVCLHCCYDVRGQTAPRCPECGQAFDPRLLDLWEHLRERQVETPTDPRAIDPTTNH